MKTLALLGGMTYEATSGYYNLINRHVRTRLGPQCSAPLYLYSCDQETMLQYAVAGHWDKFTDVYTQAARTLVDTGKADAIVLCACLAHRVAEDIEKQIKAPLLHIADFVGMEIKRQGFSKVALLGTKVVMEGDFIRRRIENKFGIEILIPEQEHDRDAVNKGIVNELTKGKVSQETKAMFLDQTDKLIANGAQGLILGSTDLGFAIQESDVSVPLFDTGKVHALGVAEWAIREDDQAPTAMTRDSTTAPALS